uniref:Putative DNA primase/helicase n=1 Tax=Candidatus Kentrum sp. FW TaxID=2126338 RepID=A0A450TW93_9GAMM|nr:MAG: putative DNA primase/helicase [Candidatus Kentron sp. FW]
MAPKKGKCDLLLELIHYLCNRNQEGDVTSRWLLKWMAYPLQNPGGKMNSAVIMHGPAGTGKSSIWKVYREIYGDYGRVISQRALEDKFNSDWGQIPPSSCWPRRSSAARRCGAFGTS